MRVTRITDQITFNPDTGNYHVTDASGDFIGDTTQRDIAFRWAGQAAVAEIVFRVTRGLGEIIAPGHSYHSVTEQISSIVQNRPTSRGWILGFAGHIEVLDPPQLREDIRATARLLLDQHDLVRK